MPPARLPGRARRRARGATSASPAALPNAVPTAPTPPSSSQVLFGRDNDDEVIQLFKLNRDPLLPPLHVCQRMDLDELKAMKKSGRMKAPTPLALLLPPSAH